MSRSPPRKAWIDSVKGVAIVLVVFGHTWRGIAEAGLFKNQLWLYEAIDTRIYAFHMPLFFLLSGLFIVQAIVKRSTAAFLIDRAMRLLYPLVLWTYIFIGFKGLAGSLANTPLKWSEISLIPIPGQWQFWFLWALFLQHIFLLIALKFLRTDAQRKSALLALLVLTIIWTILPWPAVVLRQTNLAPLYAPYLLLGAVLSAYGYLRSVPGHVGLPCLVTFALVLALIPDLRSLQIPTVVSATVLSLTFFFGLAWLLKSQTKASEILAALGSSSMIIFLSHTIFSAGTRIGLLQLGFESLLAHLILGTLTGLLFPLAIFLFARRYNFTKLLGA